MRADGGEVSEVLGEWGKEGKTLLRLRTLSERSLEKNLKESGVFLPFGRGVACGGCNCGVFVFSFQLLALTLDKLDLFVVVVFGGGRIERR